MQTKALQSLINYPYTSNAQKRILKKQIEIMQEQENIKENFTFQLHGIFDKFNRCNYISDDFMNSNELHYLIEHYNKNCQTINDENQEEEFINIMDYVCVYYQWQFASLKANYKSRLYLKLWLKKLIINIW